MNQFDWLQETLYEPPPAQNYRRRSSLSLRAFLTIAVLVMVAVGLWAVN